MDLSQERLRELLDYDLLSGVFKWKVSTARRIKVGDVAGSPKRFGHLQIMVDGRFYKAHRLAWLYVHGRWPVEQIDHINGMPSDNRITNLREVTCAENQQNQRSKPNKLLGVSWHTKSNKWQARILVHGVLKHLGVFVTPKEAHVAYVAAKHEYHPFGTL